LSRSHSDISTTQSEEIEMAKLVQLSRLLAYIIQIGMPNPLPNTIIDTDIIESQLGSLNLDIVTLKAIQSALKVPQSIDSIDKIDPDIAARAFPLVVKIAWMDNQITDQESQALKTLLALISPNTKN
jgi:hypothetical protein